MGNTSQTPFTFSVEDLHFLSVFLLNMEQREGQVLDCDFSTVKESKRSFLPRHSHSRNNNIRTWSVPKCNNVLPIFIIINNLFYVAYCLLSLKQTCSEHLILKILSFILSKVEELDNNIFNYKINFL